MESWVGSLFKDIKEKVGISGSSLSSSSTTAITVSARDFDDDDVLLSTELIYDYFPYGLSTLELQLFIRYIMKRRHTIASSGLTNILGRLLFMEDLSSKYSASTPCLELDMSRMGHACVALSLGESSWPPESGYSFVSWFKYRKVKSQTTENSASMRLQLFSVSSTENENAHNEVLYLEDGVLVLEINGSTLVSLSNLGLKEDQWYHLAVVFCNRFALAEEHFRANLYLDGKLRHTSEFTLAPVLPRKNFLIAFGMPAFHSTVSDFQWVLCSCYLFQEQLSADCIQIMYFLGSGDQDLSQESDTSYSTTTKAVGDERFPLIDLSTSFVTESTDEVVGSESDGAKPFLTLEMLEKIWLQLCGKRLICAFNAATTEALPSSQTLTLLNLVHPMSAIASPTGTQRSGHLYGDVSICRRCVTGNIIDQTTWVSVVLALIESAETEDMLHIALTLLAAALHQSSQRGKQMKACRGYQLLSFFLRTQISLFNSQCLQILFKIAVSEDSLRQKAAGNGLASSQRIKFMSQDSCPELELTMLQDERSSAEFSPKFELTMLQDDHSSAEYHESMDNMTLNEETFNLSPSSLNPIADALSSISGALCDADIVEHVLLDWTIWTAAPVSIQLEILNFFEMLVSVYKYKDHNLAVLRGRSFVQHLLVALHRDDIEVIVLEKFVILLAIFLEDKFLISELDSVTKFVLTTFDPPEVRIPIHVMREMKSRRVTLRNMLLEALIDLQVTITSMEILEQWHTIVSSKLVSCFLDEAVHPSTMVWIITLLGLCLASSSDFTTKFQRSGGYETLDHLLPRFNDLTDIYYTLFCLIFDKPIYPKLPEVGILDFEALMPSNGNYINFKFMKLLDSVVTMIKSVFDQITVQPIPTDQAVSISPTTVEFVEANTDIIEVVTDEASLASTRTASPGWDSAARATSVLRFMANLAKMQPAFSRICGRTEFLERCVDLYFSIARAYLAVNATSEPPAASTVLSFLVAESDQNSETRFSSHSSIEGETRVTSSYLLQEMDFSGYIGDPGSAGATAVLDLLAEVLSGTLIQQSYSVAVLQSILESVPLNFDSETVLTFQALSLDRIINYLERRLLHNDEIRAQMLDNNNLWSNLGSFCSLIVDCVYLGVFPRPLSVMRVLELCLSMLHSAKTDGQIEEAALPWTGLLSIWRENRPVDVILKSTNRMILYCFLPSFLSTIGEEALISSNFRRDQQKGNAQDSSPEETRIDICIILEVIHAHKEVMFHSSNADPVIYCALCINLIALFREQRKDARNAAISILKYLLVHCRSALEDMFISKPNQDLNLDVLNGGFDKLLTESVPNFMEWFVTNEGDINRVLQQCASIRWLQYIAESERFPVERLALLEDHRTTKMGRKVEDASKLSLMYRDHFAEQRSGLEATRNTVCIELEHAHKKKYDSVIHAENEWRTYIHQLGHEHKLDRISSMTWEDYWPLC